MAGSMTFWSLLDTVNRHVVDMYFMLILLSVGSTPPKNSGRVVGRQNSTSNMPWVRVAGCGQVLSDSDAAPH